MGTFGNTFGRNYNFSNVVVTPPPTGEAPIISDETESFLSNNRVGISCNIDPNGETTSIILEYGLTTSYGTTIVIDNLVGTSPIPISTIIPRLTPNNYHYRIVATNTEGTDTGDDQTFTIYTGVNRELTDYSAELTALEATFTGTTYYIDPDAGSDGDGLSAETPFNTWASVTSLTGGNKYLQKYGTTWTTTSSAFRTIDGRFMLGAYGTESDGIPEISINSSGTSRFIETDYQLFIKDIKISKNSLYGIGIYMINSTDSIIYNTELEGFEWPVYTERDFTYAREDIRTQWEGLKILYSKVHGCGSDALNIRYCSDVEIGHCYVYDVNKYFLVPGMEDQLSSPGDNIQLNSYHPMVVNVHHNTLDHSTTGNKFNLLLGTELPSTLECSYNHMIASRGFAGHATSSLYIGGYLQGSLQDVNIHHNIIEEQNYALYNYGIGTKFNYNTVINVVTGVQIQNNWAVDIYNNVFDNYTSRAIVKLSGASMNVRNNVFKSLLPAFNIGSGGTVVTTNNHFEGNSAVGTNNTTGSSGFVDATNRDYKITSSSVLKDSGVDVGLTEDFFGNAVPFNTIPDKGIHEYSA